MDTSVEHFELRHASAPSHVAAVVGQGDTDGLVVSYTLDDLPEKVDASLVRKHIEGELDFWCRPNPDDAWYLIDLWYLLGEHARDAANERGRVRWKQVTRSREPDDAGAFVEEVTRLAKDWMRQAWRDRDASASADARSEVRFICDYISVMAVDDTPHRMMLGRLRRLVRLQTRADRSARFEVSMFGAGYDDVRVRIQRFADLDFVDVHAVTDYYGFVVSKLQVSDGASPGPWTRGEVRKLLQHVASEFEEHGNVVDLMADAQGPHVLVRFDGAGE